MLNDISAVPYWSKVCRTLLPHHLASCVYPPDLPCVYCLTTLLRHANEHKFCLSHKYRHSMVCYTELTARCQSMCYRQIGLSPQHVSPCWWTACCICQASHARAELTQGSCSCRLCKFSDPWSCLSNIPLPVLNSNEDTATGFYAQDPCMYCCMQILTLRTQMYNIGKRSESIKL